MKTSNDNTSPNAVFSFSLKHCSATDSAVPYREQFQHNLRWYILHTGIWTQKLILYTLCWRAAWSLQHPFVKLVAGSREISHCTHPGQADLSQPPHCQLSKLPRFHSLFDGVTLVMISAHPMVLWVPLWACVKLCFRVSLCYSHTF